MRKSPGACAFFRPATCDAGRESRRVGIVRGAMCGFTVATYRVLSRQALDEAFDGCGFRVRSIHRRFVLPLAVHQTVGSRRFTVTSEKLLDRLGLLRRSGSPAMLVAERQLES